MSLCNRPGLPWGLLGLGPWYRASRVQWMKCSLCVVVTPTINQPSDMPWYAIDPSFYHFAKFNVSSFCCRHYPLIHATVAPPDPTLRCLHLHGNYSHWCCYFKNSEFSVEIHSSHLCARSNTGSSWAHVITRNVIWKLKHIPKIYCNQSAGSVHQ